MHCWLKVYDTLVAHHVLLLKSVCDCVHAYRCMSTKQTWSHISKWYDKCKVHVCLSGHAEGQKCVTWSYIHKWYDKFQVHVCSSGHPEGQM